MHAAIEEREAKLFPEREEIGRITCSVLTNEFLIYGTDVSFRQNMETAFVFEDKVVVESYHQINKVKKRFS